MHPQKKLMAAIALIGGPAVLGSYVWGAKRYPSETVGKLWGEVPVAVQPAYTSWMFVAAAGFLVLAAYLFFRVDAPTARVANRWGFGLFNALWVAILVPSAIWMPLTLHAIENPSRGLWVAIVAGLWTTGLASLAQIAAIATLRPRAGEGWWRAALVGSVLFAGQTFVLDSVVWPLYFRL